jgi:hypothetical protein
LRFAMTAGGANFFQDAMGTFQGFVAQPQIKRLYGQSFWRLGTVFFL